MNNTCVEIPEPMENIMITYKKTFYYGAYGDQTRKEIVTKRGFYSNSDGYYNYKDEWIETQNGSFKIPPEWRYFKGVLLPHGFGGDRLMPKNVISWEYCKD